MRLSLSLEVEVFQMKLDRVSSEFGLPCGCRLEDHSTDFSLCMTFSEATQVARGTDDGAQVCLSREDGFIS